MGVGVAIAILICTIGCYWMYRSHKQKKKARSARPAHKDRVSFHPSSSTEKSASEEMIMHSIMMDEEEDLGVVYTDQ